MEGDPHKVLEGMAIAGFAVGASKGFIYVRGEYYLSKLRLNQAIEQARAKGYLGEKLFGTDFSFDPGSQLELEIGGLAGLILGAAAARRPVMVDGFIATAGALVATAMAPAARDYLIAAHRSVEPERSDTVFNHLSEDIDFFQVSLAQAFLCAVMKVSDALKVNTHDLAGNTVCCENVNACYS